MTDKQLKAVAMPGDFIFHSSWFEIFKSFDMATSYAIFMAMIAYVQTGEIPADEELRRLTVFLFAHINTDRQRILSLQPKRRTSAKKKPAPEAAADPQPTDVPKPQPVPVPDPSAQPQVSQVTQVTQSSHNSHNSHNSHPAPDGELPPRTRADGAQTPRMRAHNSQFPKSEAAARLTAYAKKISAAIRRGERLPDPTRVHKRNFKKRFKKTIPLSRR